MLPGLLTVVFITSALSGAAIPAAARVFGGSGEGWATRLGLSYASNVVGAVFGSLLAGFWLVPVYGAHANLLGVSLLNILIGVGLAIVMGRRALATVALATGCVAAAPAAIGVDRLDVYRTALSARLSNTQILVVRRGARVVGRGGADRQRSLSSHRRRNPQRVERPLLPPLAGTSRRDCAPRAAKCARHRARRRRHGRRDGAPSESRRTRRRALGGRHHRGEHGC